MPGLLHDSEFSLFNTENHPSSPSLANAVAFALQKYPGFNFLPSNYDSIETHLRNASPATLLLTLAAALRRQIEMAEMDRSRWVIIYPVYINSKKTPVEGRRIGALQACENPTPAEIGDCCTYLKLNHALKATSMKESFKVMFQTVGRHSLALGLLGAGIAATVGVVTHVQSNFVRIEERMKAQEVLIEERMNPALIEERMKAQEVRQRRRPLRRQRRRPRSGS